MDCWPRWPKKSWASLGECKNLWTQFISKPHRVDGVEVSGNTQSDALAIEAFGENGDLGPRCAKDSIYFIAVVLYDVVAGPDFVAGLKDCEAATWLDSLVDLCASKDPTVRYWAIKSTWKSIQIYRNTVSYKPSLLQNKRWKQGYKMSWFDGENFKATKQTRNREEESCLRDAVDLLSQEQEDETENSSSHPDNELFDKILSQLQTAFCNIIINSYISLERAEERRNGSIQASDFHAIMELLLEEPSVPLSTNLKVRNHLSTPEPKYETFGNNIKHQVLLPVFLTLLTICRCRKSKALGLRNLNLILIKSKCSTDLLHAVRSWQTFVFLILSTLPEKDSRSDSDKDVFTFALNLVSTSALHCAHHLSKLNVLLASIVGQMQSVCEWNTNARTIVRQILLSLIDSFASSGFWRNAETLDQWKMTFQLLQFCVSFLFFMPVTLVDNHDDNENSDENEEEKERTKDRKLFPSFTHHGKRKQRRGTTDAAIHENSVLREAEGSSLNPKSPSGPKWPTTKLESKHHAAFSQMPIKVLPNLPHNVGKGEEWLGRRSNFGSFKGGTKKMFSNHEDAILESSYQLKGEEGLNNSTIDEVFESISICLMNHHIPVNKETELLLQYKPMATATVKHLASGHQNRVEHLAVQLDRVGLPADQPLINSILTLFHKMGIDGQEEEVESWAAIHMEKKERNNLYKAWDFCRAFKDMELLFKCAGAPMKSESHLYKDSYFVDDSKPAFDEWRSHLTKHGSPTIQKGSHEEIMRENEETKSTLCGHIERLERTLKSVASFLVSQCKNGNFISRKSLQKAILSRLRLSLATDMLNDNQFTDLPGSPASATTIESHDLPHGRYTSNLEGDNDESAEDRPKSFASLSRDSGDEKLEKKVLQRYNSSNVSSSSSVSSTASERGQNFAKTSARISKILRIRSEP